MISGSFHVSSQEWRYYSREKSLIHTLHLAQLPPSRVGDTVLIASTPAAQNQNGFQVPGLKIPALPAFNVGGISLLPYAFVRWQANASSTPTFRDSASRGISLVHNESTNLGLADFTIPSNGFYMLGVRAGVTVVGATTSYIEVSTFFQSGTDVDDALFSNSHRRWWTSIDTTLLTNSTTTWMPFKAGTVIRAEAGAAAATAWSYIVAWITRLSD